MDDDKKKSINKNDDNTVEVIFEGTVEMDPSSVQDGGSMSEEPSSFNSEEKSSQSSDEVQEENANSGETFYDDSDDDAEITDNEPASNGVSEESIPDESGDSSGYSDNGDTIEDETPSSNSSDSDSKSEETNSSSEPESSEESNESSSEKEENVSESDTQDGGESVSESSDNSSNIVDDSSNTSSSESGGDTVEDTIPSGSSDTTTDDTSSNSASDTSTTDSTPDTTSESDTKSNESSSSEPDSNSTKEQPQTTGGKDSGETVPDKKTEKAEKGDSKDKNNMPDNKNTPGKAADTAKNPGEKASDAAKKLPEKPENKLPEKGGNKLPEKGGGGSKIDKAKQLQEAGEALKNKQWDKIAGSKGVRLFSEMDTVPSAWVRAGLAVMDGLLGKEKTDALLDKLGAKAIKITKYVTISALISLIVPITFLVIGIYMIFAPMLDSLMSVEKVAIDLANSAEKIANLYMNGNFADSKDTFYEELDRLGRVYGNDLDASLLLATTFYTDMKSGYQTNYDDINSVMAIGAAAAGYVSDEQKTNYGASFTSLIKSEIDKIEAEAKGTYDAQTGLMYTVGKVYRLKLLANAMFNQTLFGSASDYNEQEITLKEWIETYGGQYVDALKRMMDDLFAAVGKGTLFSVLTGIPVPFIFSGSEIQDAKVLINCLFLGALSVSSIDITGGLALDQIKIKYYTYKYSEENYKKYLKETYIVNNPDFEPYISRDKDNKVIESSVDEVIDEIFEYRDYFNRLFLVQDEDDSEDYNNLCIGAIDRTLANALSAPIDIDTKNCIEFFNNNAYGYTSAGKLHNGIELNKDSTGNKEGDKVYAVMDGGTVKGSSTDGTLECVGGCIEIAYKYTTEAEPKTSYDFSIIYKGLSKTSVTLKKNDKVKDRQEVGVIGTAAESEGLSIPSLYLEFRKGDGTAIDPTNMIVKCSGIVDYPGATTINIPQSFKQANEYSFTCYGGKGWYYNCSESQERYWGTGNGQKATYEVWASQGSKFKNGIAYITVDGVDRYLVAVVPEIGNPGDVLNARFQDGSVAGFIVQDVKGAGVNSTGWGHDLSGATNVIEFQVQLGHPSGNVTKNGWDIEWETTNNPVVSFTNNGNIHSGSFSLTASSGGSSKTSGDLKLCDSMYNKNEDPQKASGPTTPSNTKMCGDTTEKKIWTFLQSKGYTNEAAAAILGIWKYESAGLKPYVVQGWGSQDSKSKDYTKKVDNGQISRDSFVNGKFQGGGYGLAQWTYSTRKANLYDYAKKTGRSIGDLQVQLEFLEKEMNSSTFKNKKTKTNMNKASSIEEAGSIFFADYQGVKKELQKKYHFDLRMKYAKEYYNDLKNFKCD